MATDHHQEAPMDFETLGNMSTKARAALRADIDAAERTIEKCRARMATCPPRSRFAYASQITKAANKRARAQYELRQLGGL